MNKIQTIKHHTSYISLVVLMLFSFTLVSCDEHVPIDVGIHPGHILLADGKIVSSDAYFSSGDSTAVGIIYSELVDGSHYLAVMLDELMPVQFCDSIGGMVQGTSCDLNAYDGRANTIKLQTSYDAKNGHGSPLAQIVYDGHVFGQSDFIPSVGEMKLLYAAKSTINGVINRLNQQSSRYKAVLISDDRVNGGCFYWTSTEVKENQKSQAWLFSMNSGNIQETGKNRYYHARKISYVYYQ